MNLPDWLQNLLPIVFLLVAVGIVTRSLPKVDLGQSAQFKRRRILNWVPLGLTYAFLYFGRYNLSAIVDLLDRQHLLTKAQFGDIDGIGATVYGLAFLINGPLTDRWGGRVTILLAAGGSAVMNVGMALTLWSAQSGRIEASGVQQWLMLFNALNMYFQSFGAVSIVKVNAHWFHVRERGVLGGLFGILISLGLYFAYDWSLVIAKNFGFVATFVVPAAVLALFFLIAVFVIRDSPSTAGFADFDTGDATSGQTERSKLGLVLRLMFSQRVILMIIVIEFCSGFLRQSVMKWYRSYASAIGEKDSFVYSHWGMLLCVAGILGGVFAGSISDTVFKSRRGPVASILYGGLLLGAIAAMFTIGGPLLAWSVILMSLSVIGVHGMLSGTMSADFGGSRNAGVVVGVIDGFVYLGTASQAFLYGHVLPVGDAAKDPKNWIAWPGWMIPFAILGLILCTRLWNARPKAGAAH